MSVFTVGAAGKAATITRIEETYLAV